MEPRKILADSQSQDSSVSSDNLSAMGESTSIKAIRPAPSDCRHGAWENQKKVGSIVQVVIN